MWNFRGWVGKIHVTGPRSLEGHRGLVVHRPRRLFPQDVTTRRGIPVTTVARTLLDLAMTLTVDQLGGCMHEAAVQHVFDPREVWAVLQRHPRHRGAKPLEAALALEVIPARSNLEIAFHRLVVRADLPRPLVNSMQWGGERKEEVDFCWPAARLIVETDGGPYHASRWRRRRDAAKDARFRAQGWTVWRVPDLEIELDPEGVIARLTTLGGQTALG